MGRTTTKANTTPKTRLAVRDALGDYFTTLWASAAKCTQDSFKLDHDGMLAVPTTNNKRKPQQLDKPAKKAKPTSPFAAVYLEKSVEESLAAVDSFEQEGDNRAPVVAFLRGKIEV